MLGWLHLPLDPAAREEEMFNYSSWFDLSDECAGRDRDNGIASHRLHGGKRTAGANLSAKDMTGGPKEENFEKRK
jgi:hypothetical protein